jgi:hypothetical protein
MDSNDGKKFGEHRELPEWMASVPVRSLVSVAGPTGKSVEEREAAVRDSGVAAAVSEALGRERLASVYTDGLERREKALMARIAELEENERRFSGDLVSAGSRIAELERELADVSDTLVETGPSELRWADKRIETLEQLVSDQRDVLLNMKRERDDAVAELKRSEAYAVYRAAAERMKAAVIDFEPPDGKAYTCGDALGLKRHDEDDIVMTRNMTAEETRKQSAAELHKRGLGHMAEKAGLIPKQPRSDEPDATSGEP